MRDTQKKWSRKNNKGGSYGDSEMDQGMDQLIRKNIYVQVLIYDAVVCMTQLW